MSDGVLGVDLGAALALLDASGDEYVGLFTLGALELGIYRPSETDAQTPHQRDELYIIASGAGEFVCDDERQTFEPGMAFAVPAGAAHRFESFTEDFATWVVFSGQPADDA